MAIRKFIHVSAVVNADLMYDLMTMFEGKAVAGTVSFRPVKHGGENEEGNIKSLPTGREFMMTFIARYPHFKVRDALAAGLDLGLKKPTVYTAINVLRSEGALIRLGDGTYKAAGKNALKKAAAVKKGAPRGHRPGKKAPPGQTVPDRIIAAVRKLQNGSGEGVPIAAVKQEIGTASGVSPAVTSLIRQKRLKRTAPSHYRVIEAQ